MMNDEQFNALTSDKKTMDRIANRVGWLCAWEIAKMIGPWLIGFAIGALWGSLRTQWLIDNWIRMHP